MNTQSISKRLFKETDSFTIKLVKIICLLFLFPLVIAYLIFEFVYYELLTINTIKTLFDYLYNSCTYLFNSVLNFLELLWSPFKSLMKFIYDSLISFYLVVINYIKANIQYIASVIYNWLRYFFNFFWNIVVNINDKLSSIFDYILDSLTKLFVKGCNMLQSLLTKVIDIIWYLLERSLEVIICLYNFSVDKITCGLNLYWSFVKYNFNKFIDLFNALYEVIQNIVSWIYNKIRLLGSGLKHNIFLPIYNTFTSLLSFIWDKIYSFSSYLLKLLKSAYKWLYMIVYNKITYIYSDLIIPLFIKGFNYFKTLLYNTYLYSTKIFLSLLDNLTEVYMVLHKIVMYFANLTIDLIVKLAKYSYDISSFCYYYIELSSIYCYNKYCDLMVFIADNIVNLSIKLKEIVIDKILVYCIYKLNDLVIYLYNLMLYLLEKLYEFTKLAFNFLWNSSIYLYNKLSDICSKIYNVWYYVYTCYIIPFNYYMLDLLRVLYNLIYNIGVKILYYLEVVLTKICFIAKATAIFLYEKIKNFFIWCYDMLKNLILTVINLIYQYVYIPIKTGITAIVNYIIEKINDPNSLSKRAMRYLKKVIIEMAIGFKNLMIYLKDSVIIPLFYFMKDSVIIPSCVFAQNAVVNSFYFIVNAAKETAIFIKDFIIVPVKNTIVAMKNIVVGFVMWLKDFSIMIKNSVLVPFKNLIIDILIWIKDFGVTIKNSILIPLKNAIKDILIWIKEVGITIKNSILVPLKNAIKDILIWMKEVGISTKNTVIIPVKDSIKNIFVSIKQTLQSLRGG